MPSFISQKVAGCVPVVEQVIMITQGRQRGELNLIRKA